MNTPENTTTRIDGKAVNPESEAAPLPAGGAAPETSEPSIEERVAKLQAELAEGRSQALRDRADLENTRKRLQREKEDAVKYANANLLERLLPVVDNFELGLQSARNSPEAAAVVHGMAMVQKQIEAFLSENGMTATGSVGERFDPNLHDALGDEPSSTVPEGHVLRVQRKGYKLKDRLLRPASVFVSKGNG
jgi:molecular chaperone GrpE